MPKKPHTVVQFCSMLQCLLSLHNGESSGKPSGQGNNTSGYTVPDRLCNEPIVLTCLGMKTFILAHSEVAHTIIPSFDEAKKSWVIFR